MSGNSVFRIGLRVLAVLLLAPLCACGNIGIEHSLGKKDPVIFGFDQLQDPNEKAIRKALYYPKSKNRQLARVSIWLDSARDADPMVINIMRRDRAYLAEAPLIRDGHTTTSVVMGYDRDQDYTAALRWRLEF